MISLRRAVVCGVLFTAAAVAQNVSVVRANSYEIGGFVGASYGLDKFRVMGGGNVTYAVNRYILPYVEFSYFPEIQRQVSGTFAGTGRPYQATYSIPVTDFHAGVHIRLPIIRESPIVPYLAIGAGGLRAGKTTYQLNGAGLEGFPPVTQPSQTVFAVNGGGGLRFYMGQRYGMRAEAKVYGPTGNFGGTFAKVEVGFFFQLR